MTPKQPTTRRPSPPPEEKIRTCSNCGREIFNPPGEGIAGDEKLCTDCWEGDGEAEFV